MYETTDNALILDRGYEYWTLRKRTPEQHAIAFVPQSIFDGWEAYCSCCRWKAFVSLSDLTEKDLKDARQATLRVLDAAFQRHLIRCDELHAERMRKAIS